MGLDLSVRGSTVPAAFNRGNRTKDQNCAWLSEIIEIVFYPKCTENSGMCYEIFVKYKLENYDVCLESIWIWKAFLKKKMEINFSGNSDEEDLKPRESL